MQAGTLPQLRNRIIEPTAQDGLAPFDCHSQPRLIFGAGTPNRLGELARELGGTRVLPVTEPGLEPARTPGTPTETVPHETLQMFFYYRG